MRPQFHLFLPQMRLSFDALVDRARHAEEAGFTGMALMDHLAPPMAEQTAMYEAMTTATWLAARTERLVIGHLVLCDALRHPAVLAKQAVSIDHASGGRFELGIGWGSVPAELETYGVGDTAAGPRVRRLGETLEVLRLLWSGEPVHFEGEFHTISGGLQQPPPLSHIPVVVGGAGKKTLELVARYADWWNLSVNVVPRLSELKDQTGTARTSVQEMVTFVTDESRREETVATAVRRFGNMGPIAGNPDELLEHFKTRMDQGVERFYVWFTDFADPATLDAFGDEVIAAL